MDPAEYAVQREYMWRFIKGMNAEVFVLLYEKQQGKCPICEEALVLGGTSGTHVDHDHKTQYVRGLLCGRCNNLLGFARDSEKTLLRAIEYLTNPPLKFRDANAQGL